MTDHAARIRNPILPGFNPDPSIVRVGDDYYIATSTFEWYPGVQIHHSRDLVHWRLLTRPLNRASQLNMLGDPDSCGIWAPCLSYADGLFWLIYTDVKRYGRTTQGGAAGASLRDTHNYLVTSPRIDGEWSDPVYLNSSGFDPSLFHDDDGRKYLVNMRWDHRPGCNRFAGIVLQEYSPAERKLVGPVHLIFQGTPIGFTEGPHLYKRNGYYYLLTAEGGTGWGHAVTMARSRELTGPYELHPDVYILTSRHRPDIELQRAGHADLVETPNGETYMVHLCGRPLPQSRALHAGPRNRDPADGVVGGRLAAHRGWQRASRTPKSRRRRCRNTFFPHRPSARTSTVRESAVGFSVAAVSLAGGALQPDRTSRAICACTAAKRWAASSGSRWSPGASSRIASAPRR